MPKFRVSLLMMARQWKDMIADDSDAAIEQVSDDAYVEACRKADEPWMFVAEELEEV